MRVNAYLTLTGVLFAVLGGLHILRLIYAWPAQVGSWPVPMALSWAGAPIAIGICLWAIVLLRRRS